MQFLRVAMRFLRSYENRRIEISLRFFGGDEENGRLYWLTKPSVRLCLKRTTEKKLLDLDENMSVYG